MNNNCWEDQLSNFNHQRGQVEDEIYMSDEFRMFAYKIKRCPRSRSHDWTECPYAHRGEKAQRRDPRRFRYSAIACATFRDTTGLCPRGDSCEYAHGVFEYWLHPAKYRTRACNAGKYCQRKVCFFAHSSDQLRPETKYKKQQHNSQLTNNNSTARRCRSLVTENKKNSCSPSHGDVEEISDLLRNLKGLGSKGSRSRQQDEDVDQQLTFQGSNINANDMEEVIHIPNSFKEKIIISNQHCHSQIKGIGLVALDALSSDEELQRLGWIAELLD